MFKGIFGSLFDFNGDGKMSAAESAMEFMFLDHLEKEARKRSEEDWGRDDWDNGPDLFDDL